MNLEREADDHAVYIHTSKPGVSQLTGTQYEKRIDERYLDYSHTKTKAFRLESYRSQGTVSSAISTQLRCYFIRQCQFVVSEPTPEQMNDIKSVSDKTFLEKATPFTIGAYQRIIDQVLVRSGPVIEKFDVPNSNKEKRLVIGYKFFQLT